MSTVIERLRENKLSDDEYRNLLFGFNQVFCKVMWDAQDELKKQEKELLEKEPLQIEQVGGEPKRLWSAEDKKEDIVE